jgi:uncharacterized protein YegL
MAGEAARQVNEAVASMLAEMQTFSQGTKPYFRLTIIKFGSRPHALCVAENEQAVDQGKVLTMSGESGTTNMAAALDLAASVLQQHPGQPKDFVPFVFLMSDGRPDDAQQALHAAGRLKDLVIAAGRPTVVAIGLGDADDQLMATIASQPELYKRLPSADHLKNLFPVIGTLTSTKGGEKAVTEVFVNL